MVKETIVPLNLKKAGRYLNELGRIASEVRYETKIQDEAIALWLLLDGQLTNKDSIIGSNIFISNDMSKRISKLFEVVTSNKMKIRTEDMRMSARISEEVVIELSAYDDRRPTEPKTKASRDIGPRGIVKRDFRRLGRANLPQ